MSLYWVREGPSQASGEFNASHRLALPGVRCDVCGATWADVGFAYPGVAPSGVRDRSSYETPGPVSLERFKQLRDAILPFLPRSAPLSPPGTNFGPLVGTAWGDFGDVAWLNPWTLLMRRRAFESLEHEGVRGVVAVAAQLRFRRKDHPELLELQIEPGSALHASCLPPDLPDPCVGCGRQGFTRPERIVVDEHSVPDGVDLFRMANFSTIIVGTERFAGAVRRLQLAGLSLKEVEVK